MVYPDQRNSGSVGVGITEKGSWGIAVPKILERARETSPAGRCHHGVAACSDLGPSGVVWHFLCVPSVCHLLYSSVIRARSSEQVNSARGVYPYRVYLYSAFQHYDDRVRYRHERHLQLTRAVERLVLREWTRVGSCFPQDRSCGAEAGFAEATCRPDV